MSRPLPQRDEAPPGVKPWVPLAWLGCAVLWLLIGAIGLASIAPGLAFGTVYDPAVFAVTHVFTLGLIASAIFGALHQFIPVVLGVAIRNPRVAEAGFWLSQAGTGVLVIGFWAWSPLLQALGWLVVFAAVGAASWTVLPARRRATQHREVGVFVSLGHSALGLAMGVALVRIGHGLGWWPASREGLLAAHLHLGLAGFGSLTAVGMTTRMLPAFFKSPEVPEGVSLTWIAGTMSVGLVLLSAGAIWGGTILIWLGGVPMLAGAVLHLRLLMAWWRARTVAKVDPALGFIGAAIVWLGVTALAGLWMLVVQPPPGRAWAAYAVVGVIGWLGHLIVGVMHRIGPRLVANLRARRGRSRPEWLSRGEVRYPALSWFGLAAMATGTAALAITIAAGGSGQARWGARLLLAGAAAVAAQGLRLARA